MTASLVAFLAMGWAWVLGVLAVAACWPRNRRAADDAPLVAAFGLWIGLAITATIFCAATLVASRPGLLAGAVELALALVLGWRVARRRAAPGGSREERTWRVGPASAAGWLVGSVFVQAAVVAAVVAVRAYRAEPYGGWDAWAIWNMRARFLFHGGTSWPELMRVPSIHWAHPDYPWVVPASIARVWTWMGSDAPWGAGLVSLAFAAATVAILVTIVARVRGRVIALIGGLLLIGTPFFVTFHEHADVPLGGAMLAAVAAIVLAARHPEERARWWLAGGCTAMAAWVKNEGLLFALVAAGVLAIHAWRARTWRRAIGFAGGLVLAALPLVAFKFVAGAPNDLLEQPLGPRLAWLLDPQRHAIIGEWLGRALPGFGEWRVVPFVAMAAAFAAPGWRKLDGAERTLPAIVLLMLAGYYAVYLLSPHHLSDHLETSLVRLLLQLWPLVILGWCLMVPGEPEAVAQPAAARGRRRVVFAAVNLALALGSVTLLSRQLAANEFDAARIGGNEVRASLGAGWFGMERAEGERWAWSEGASTLLLHAPPAARGSTVKLRFDVRGLGRRAVTVRAGERGLWRGAVGEEFVRVVVSGVTLESETTAVHFETDAPGVAEAPNPDARKLTFAIYNLRIE